MSYGSIMKLELLLGAVNVNVVLGSGGSEKVNLAGHMTSRQPGDD